MPSALIRRRETVAVTIDPYDLDPRKIAGWLRAVFRRIADEPRPIRLVIRFAAEDGGENRRFFRARRPRPAVPVGLDFTPATGKPVVFAGEARAGFDLRRLWIPEHPVPLAFPCALLIDPAPGGRFRARKTLSSGMEELIFHGKVAYIERT